MAQWSKEVFAKNLRHYMERSGKTQRDMAEIVGVSTATFSEWINAKKYPRIDKIETLANYFGILKSDLIEDKEDVPSRPEREEVEIIKDPNAENEQWLIDIFRSLPDEDKSTLMSFALYLEQQAIYKNVSENADVLPTENIA